MKNESNDQFLDRLELERLEREGYEFPELRKAMSQDIGYRNQNLDQAINKVVSRL